MAFAANQSEFAQALLNPTSPMPSGITTARGDGDDARFAVYRNNVFVGLTGALAKRFPVVRRLVGEEFFAGMARVFAGLHKPSSPVLFEYGGDFPDFIERFEPAQGLPYLGGVARIETAWTRAYHAKDAAPLALSALAAIEAGSLGLVHLAAHSSASLVSSPYPIGSIWAAHQHETPEPLQASRAETVLVVRPEMDVSVIILPPEGAAFAQSLFAGERLDAASQSATLRDENFDFGRALVGLISLGAFGEVKQKEKAT